jgi:NAD(P)H-hydrate epimerase
LESDVKLVTVEQMQAIEREADANGLSYAEMMEIAGSGLVEEVVSAYDDLKSGGILGLVGSGNNGGDALVALAQLAEMGWRATAYIVKSREEDDPLIDRLVAKGGNIIIIKTDPDFRLLKSAIKDHAVLMDGVLGTGIKLPLKGKLAEALGIAKKVVNQIQEKPRVVAVDCPSGVDCDTGQVASECLEANLTVTMAAVKKGMLEFPANNYLGELRLVGIGLKKKDKRSKIWQDVKRIVVDREWVRDILPPRPRDAHKGTFGTALIVAGSVNYTGAALLAGLGAYRVGVGLVTLAIPAPLHSALAGQFPEGTWLLLPHELGVIEEGAAEVILENLDRPTAMLLGPGFGVEDETQHFLEKLLVGSPTSRRGGIGFVTETDRKGVNEIPDLPPLVIDADGLKLLARIPDWHEKISQPAILTPHPGEMAVLTDLEVAEIQSNRLSIAEKYALEWEQIIVLKGANTVVAEPGGRTAVIPVASAALARAGTGDVLAGIIVGLRGQGVDAFEAAVSGCWIHAQSGLQAAESLQTVTPVLASDLLPATVKVISDLETGPR